MFDLEKEIRQWLRSFSKHRAFDHGVIREMEQHLRDHIDDLVAKGKPTDEAFRMATAEFGDVAQMGDEELTNVKRKKNLTTVVHSATLPLNKFSFTIAIRNLIRRPLFSFIKIAGLSVGVSGCVIVFLMARLELSFDKHHPDGDKIYRIYSSFSGVWEGINPAVPLPLPDAFRDRAHGVDAVSQVLTDNLNVEVPDASGKGKKFVKPNFTAYVDHNYFDVFQAHRWLAGTPKVLDAPDVVVLTESKAKKYFGETDFSKTVGKRLIYRDSLEVTVAGIIADQLDHTDFEFTDFISLPTLKTSRWKEKYDFEGWGNISSAWQCFIRLSKNASVDGVDHLLKEMSHENDEKSAVKGQPRTTFTLFKTQPLGDIHFNTKMGTWNDGRSPASRQMIEALGAIAVLLLVIAVINFVNLETAQALRRTREVGLRKVMGGTRGGLLIHFITEGFVITSIAVLLSVPLSKLAISAFHEFLPSELTLDILNPTFVLFLGALLLIIPLLSGTYPALALSSFQPVDALRMKSASGGSNSAFLRKTLTVVQFTFSQALIAAALIVSLQITWMINKNLGFSREAVVTVKAPYWEKTSKRTAFRRELEQLSAIAIINQSTRPPAFNGSSTTTLRYNNGKEDVPNSVHYNGGDTTYVSLFGLKLIAGRNVTPIDSLGEILINETYCKKLNVAPIDMVGKELRRGNGKRYVVVGVLKDFNHTSLHSAIQPWCFEYEDNSYLFSLKLASTANTQDAISQIKKAWNKIYPDTPAEVSFLDDTVRKFYEQERRVAILANTATVLAIFISCLGLFGLASFRAIQRTKEIGIRKVLGASVNGIMTLLSKEFILLIGLSFLFSIPIAWYAGRQWLSGFAYSMDLGIWIFLVAGALSIAIAILTIGFQAAKAAIRNPVESLRYE